MSSARRTSRRARRPLLAGGALVATFVVHPISQLFCAGRTCQQNRRSVSGAKLHGRADSTTTVAQVQEVTKHIRLPVWPAWFGIFYIILDLVTGKSSLGAKLEDWLGGRVCPMIFSDNLQATDPFLLVAHHRHSFNVLDPLRYIFRSVLMPEGFPAHAHRGFETVTYVLRGGLVHRDSLGVKKSYGAAPDSDGSGADAAVQWMTAGRGMRHEEMWRTGSATDSTDQELFQIWVNLPSAFKMVPPRMQMFGSSGSQGVEGAQRSSADVSVCELGPVPAATPKPGVTVRVISGTAAGITSPVETYSPVAILHVTLDSKTSWTWPRPSGWTCLAYTRRGEVFIGEPRMSVPTHVTATLTRDADAVVLHAGEEGADVLLLAGAPISEPIEMGANVVMNTPSELAQADIDLQRGLFGPSWRHTVDDETWRQEVANHWGSMTAMKLKTGSLLSEKPS